MNENSGIQVHRLRLADLEEHPMMIEFYETSYGYLGKLHQDNFLGEEGRVCILFTFLTIEQTHQLKTLLDSYHLLLDMREITDDLLFNLLFAEDYAIFHK
jgi:hypothetical protein